MPDYEYVRLGTLSLLAAIDLLTGEAIPLVSPTHKSSDFVRFLKMLDEKYPVGDKVRIILDNHSAHTSRETQEYLNTVPDRFEFVFTPTHGSWLNMVEVFFSKLTKQMLDGIWVSSKEELESRIYQYFDEINKVPVPYHWSTNLRYLIQARFSILDLNTFEHPCEYFLRKDWIAFMQSVAQASILLLQTPFSFANILLLPVQCRP